MATRHGVRRGGYTLLEMILALSISLLLVFGLYMALEVHLNATRAGRSMVDEASEFEAVTRKVTGDISENLAMINNVNPLIQASTNQPNTVSSGYSATPTASSTSSSSSSASGSSSSTSSSTTSGSMTIASSTISTSSSSSASSTTTTQTQYYPFNLGVQGTSSYMSIYASQVSYAAANQAASTGSPGPADQASDCDLRRITYWVPSSGQGLYRQEIGKQFGDYVTDLSTLTSSMPPDASDTYSSQFSKDVIDVSFEYFDGANWNDSWDGTTLAADGMTAMGPPMAIAINLKIARRDAKSADPSDSKSFRSFRHVVQIPTAINWQNYQSSYQYQNLQSSGSSTSSGGNE